MNKLLFTPGARGSTNTRIESFKKTEKDTVRRLVFNTITEQGPISRNALSKFLKIRINSVTGRCSELVKAGFIVSIEKAYDPETDRNVELLIAVAGVGELD